MDKIIIKPNNIYNMDCVDGMKEMESGSVDLVVTSPPYFLNKEYEKEWTYDYYMNLMDNVFKYCSIVLKKGAYLVVNFGDYYNSGNRFYDSDVPSVYPASLNYFKWGLDNGFDLQATRIWRKKFAKMAIPIVCNSHPRNVFDYEHIWTFRKKGTTNEFVNDRKLSQRGVLGDDWLTPAKISQHCAAFPKGFPKWAISVYSKNVGDIVLDPFMGSGTTAEVARALGRRWIGFEISREYCELANKRLQDTKTLFDFD